MPLGETAEGLTQLRFSEADFQRIGRNSALALLPRLKTSFGIFGSFRDEGFRFAFELWRQHSSLSGRIVGNAQVIQREPSWRSTSGFPVDKNPALSVVLSAIHAKYLHMR